MPTWSHYMHPKQIDKRAGVGVCACVLVCINTYMTYMDTWASRCINALVFAKYDCLQPTTIKPFESV